MDIEKIKKFFSGKYEFIKLLGRGGFAEVHLALDKMLERKVAIKILLTEHASDPDIVKRFIREARLYAKLEHPNLINIYETGLAEGTAFIVMKYVKGENLKSYIQKDVKTRLALAPKVIFSLSGALDYIHKNGIIHRDIKPANIILEDGGENIYLADFGIARSVSSQTMTQTGSIMGTPYYISPEQIKGGVVDQRSDIYALGATLYELITGKPVFSADSSVEILYKHVNSEPEHLGKVLPQTPKILKYIVSRCLEKKPEKRFQTSEEISDTLKGKKSASITRYLNSLESGKISPWKKLILLITLMIIIPLSTFLLYKEFSGVRTNDPGEIQNQTEKNGELLINKSGIKADIKKENIPGNGEAGKKETDAAGREPEKNIPPEIRQKKTSEIIPEKNNTVVEPPENAAMDTPGIIRFSSYPPADIYWNGLKLGNTTQIFKKNFPPGQYKIIFKIEGYISEERNISVEPGEEVPAHHRFSPYGYLTITARPFAKFYINGIDSGENPIFEKKFPVGTYKIEAVKKGYKTEEKIIKIENMKKSNISFSLKKKEEK